ncbi:ATP-dependent DNA helicase-like protein [Betaproteobacteria bacterium]|nr:ATP-dependent DNA helicase-like protein [Betaproteobacteria bacterium]
MSEPLSALFSPQGPLAAAISGFRVRSQQAEMADRVAAAIAGQKVFIAEAGTGTGKTFAYLAPALLSGGKVMISTGTKTLQDQLFNKDLPLVRAALNAPVQVALLKGRANYVCHYYLRRAATEGRFFNREEVDHFARIQRYFKQTRSGDKAECGDVPESSPVWSQVTSTRDNCLGQECPDHKDCCVQAARKAAMEADLVVVNHHLFFADVMLRDEGVAELLPACNTVIFDEAHQLPEVASLFFGENVSTSQVIDLVRDSKAEGLAAARDCLDLQSALAALEKSARDLRLAVGVDSGRFPARQIEETADFLPALQQLLARLEESEAILKTQAERSEGLEKCWQRALELRANFIGWRDGSQSQADGDTGKKVRWCEAFSHSLQLNATPLSVADIFARQMGGHPRAWIFTSATLAVQGRFEHYQSELGLWEAETGCWDSPFDYARQALLYAPQGLPEPNSWGYTEAVAEAAFPLIDACGGGAFFLCTSLRAMRRIYELLQEHLEKTYAEVADRPPLFLQGECGKNELLDRFRQVGNGILVGSQSFWEGVDVRGEALSLVVIDKLPFAPPDDPVLSARIEAMKKAGRNAFLEYQLPRAVINVKQGAGRLIRTESDKGVLMICDPRMLNKPYGYRIWRSLPPMRRARDLRTALEFLGEKAGANE